MSERMPKINSLINQELSQILNHKVDLPNNCLVTIINVDTSKDLKQAKVLISVLPHHNGPQILKKISKRSNEFRRLLKKKLSLKYIPQLRFQWDHTENEAQKIETILNQIERENNEQLLSSQ